MKKIMLSLLVLFILLSTLAVAQSSSFAFDPVPGLLVVTSGDSLSYQVNIKTNLKLTDNPFEVDDSSFSITKTGLLTSNSPLMTGVDYSFNITVHETLGSFITTLVEVKASSQSSLPKTTGDWLSRSGDLKNSLQFNSVYDKPSWLSSSCSKTLSFKSHSVTTNNGVSYAIGLSGENSKLAVFNISDCTLNEYIIGIKNPGKLFLTEDLFFATDSDTKLLTSWINFYDLNSKSLLRKSDSFPGTVVDSFIDNNNLILLTTKNLVSIDVNSGVELWSVPFNIGINDFVFDDSSNSIFLISDSTIFSYDISTGIKNWEQSLTLSKKSTLFIDSGYLYSTNDKTLFRLDLSSGVLGATYDLSSLGSIYEFYAIKGDTIYVDLLSGKTHEFSSFNFLTLSRENYIDLKINSLFFDSNNNFYFSVKKDLTHNTLYFVSSGVVLPLTSLPVSSLLIPVNNNLVTVSLDGFVVLTESEPQNSFDAHSWLMDNKNPQLTSNDADLDLSSIELDSSLTYGFSSDINILVDSSGMIFKAVDSSIRVYNSDLTLDSTISITDSKNTPLAVTEFILSKDYVIVSARNYISVYQKDGTKVWQYDLSSPFSSILFVNNNVLYLSYSTIKGNYLQSFDLISGDKLSSYSLKASDIDVLEMNGYIYVLDYTNFALHKLDLDLSKIWISNLNVVKGLKITDILAISSSDNLIIANGYTLLVYNSDGLEISHSLFSSNLLDLTLLDSSTIAFQDSKYSINLFDLVSNSLICSYTSPEAITSHLSSSKNGIIFGATNSFDVIDSSCDSVSSFSSLDAFNLQPVLTNSVVYLSSKLNLEKYYPISISPEQPSRDLEFSVSVLPGCAGDSSFVIYDENGDPVSGANIRLISPVGSFNVNTDEDGLASIFLPKSSYVLDVTASGYQSATGTFDVITCSSKSAAEIESQISDIVKSFSSSASQPVTDEINIPGSAVFEFSTFNSASSASVKEEVEASTKSIFDDSEENVFMFKSATAFSLFMLLLVVLLIVIGMYVKYKVAAHKAFNSIEDEVIKEAEHLEKEVVDEVRHVEDGIKDALKK